MDQPEPGAPAPVFPYKSSSIPANNIPYKPSAEN
jgi:hypothetical protein